MANRCKERRRLSVCVLLRRIKCSHHDWCRFDGILPSVDDRRDRLGQWVDGLFWIRWNWFSCLYSYPVVQRDCSTHCNSTAAESTGEIQEIPRIHSRNQSIGNDSILFKSKLTYSVGIGCFECPQHRLTIGAKFRVPMDHGSIDFRQGKNAVAIVKLSKQLIEEMVSSIQISKQEKRTFLQSSLLRCLTIVNVSFYRWCQ